jgi:hypothetical protein
MKGYSINSPDQALWVIFAGSCFVLVGIKVISLVTTNYLYFRGFTNRIYYRKNTTTDLNVKTDSTAVEQNIESATPTVINQFKVVSTVEQNIESATPTVTNQFKTYCPIESQAPTPNYFEFEKFYTLLTKYVEEQLYLSIIGIILICFLYKLFENFLLHKKFIKKLIIKKTITDKKKKKC